MNDIDYEKKYIYILKCLAVLSIVTAHCGNIARDNNIIANIFYWIMTQIGAIGVGVFYIISGYLFYKNLDSFKLFFSKKVKGIVVPWIITGSFVYLVMSMKNNVLNLKSFIGFLFLGKSYLYYLSILMIFYLIYFFIKNNQNLLIAIILISIVSILATATGVLDFINPYINPLNFAIYFSFGILIKKQNLLNKLSTIFYKKRVLLTILYVFSLYIIYKFNITSGYWGYSTLIIQPIAIILIMGIARSKLLKRKNIMYVGKQSFAIYLIHRPIAYGITIVFKALNLWQFMLIMPVVIILITIVCIEIYRYIANKIFKTNKLNFIVGIR